MMKLNEGETVLEKSSRRIATIVAVESRGPTIYGDRFTIQFEDHSKLFNVPTYSLLLMPEKTSTREGT